MNLIYFFTSIIIPYRNSNCATRLHCFRTIVENQNCTHIVLVNNLLLSHLSYKGCQSLPNILFSLFSTPRTAFNHLRNLKYKVNKRISRTYYTNLVVKFCFGCQVSAFKFVFWTVLHRNSSSVMAIGLAGSFGCRWSPKCSTCRLCQGQRTAGERARRAGELVYHEANDVEDQTLSLETVERGGENKSCSRGSGMLSPGTIQKCRGKNDIYTHT